ncbi:MAG: acetoacetate decarboxylase family protein [Aquabacterium sp.]|nr:acetoacetate decarboxylase family protein [Aquabacterium sp.]
MSSTLSFVSQDPFFNVPRTLAQTSQGPAQLPILYHRTRNINAFFMVDTQAVQAALRAAGAGALQATCNWGGKTLVALACYEYQDTSIGVYNEIGLAVPVVRPGIQPRLSHWLQTLRDVDDPSRDVGFYVLHLPVDTDAACAAGREIWGLPKFVTPIDFGRVDQQVDVVLFDPDHPKRRDHAILRLAGRLGASLPGPTLCPLLYSQVAGRWQRTAVNARGGGRVHAGAGLQLQLSTSQHPMTQTLRALGLDGARPWLVLDTDRFQSRLNPGRDMAGLA